MDSKLYILAIICLTGGLVGGYIIASISIQNQNVAFNARLQGQDAEITAKDALLQAKDAQLLAKDAQIQAQDVQIQAQAAQLQAQSILIETQGTMLQQLMANVTRLQEQIQAIIG